MRRRLLLGCLLLFVVAGVGLALALRHEPDFYSQLTIEPDEKVCAQCDALLETASALASKVQEPGSWQATFTEAQLNGWLAVDLEQNHADALPAEIEDPRIHLGKDYCTLAFRFRQPGFSTVASLDFELYLAEPNVIALRIERLRAGAIPLPKRQVLDLIVASTSSFNLPLRWVQEEGDPVALITLPNVFHEDGTVYRLHVLEVTDGEVFVAGETVPAPPDAVAIRLSEPAR